MALAMMIGRVFISRTPDQGPLEVQRAKALLRMKIALLITA